MFKSDLKATSRSISPRSVNKFNWKMARRQQERPGNLQKQRREILIGGAVVEINRSLPSHFD